MKSPDHPLSQATLQEIDSQPTNPKPKGGPIPVQFNPASLKLSMQNNVDMKKAYGKRPATQYDGTSSSTLTFDLVFDTTDEGTPDEPVDVRKRIAPIERFLLPGPGEKKSIPPRVQFTYGTFQLIGVMTALNADYDLFSGNGVPLRARLNVTIKEQLPEYEAGVVGPGLNTGTGAKDAQGLVPGGAPRSTPDQTGTALGGETAPDFAARMGLDPSAWAELDLGGADALSLTAGLTIDFSASIGIELGLTAGFSAGIAVDADIFGGDAAPAPAAITAAGGLQAAAEAGASWATAVAADSARSGFATPSRPPAVPTARPTPAPRRPDPRALSFGRGVPLRDAVVAPAENGRLGDSYVPARPSTTPPGGPRPTWAGPSARAGQSTRGGEGPARDHCECGCGGRR